MYIPPKTDSAIISIKIYDKKKNITVTPEEFYHALGNMYSMYETLPLATTINSQKLNATVEKDLYNYLNMKGLFTKSWCY